MLPKSTRKSSSPIHAFLSERKYPEAKTEKGMANKYNAPELPENNTIRNEKNKTQRSILRLFFAFNVSGTAPAK